MKKINTDSFKLISKQLIRQDLKARKLLVKKIYEIYSPFLRDCPNVSGNRKMVCPVNRKTGKFDEITVVKRGGVLDEDVIIMAYWNNSAIMTDAHGGGFTAVPLIEFELRILVKIYEATYKLFSGKDKQYTFQ